MELELVTDPTTVAGLSRLKALAASRDGKARSQTVKLVWYDSPEHALFADGLTLAEQRGTRRLERIVPGDETWLPAQPVPVVTESPDAEALPSPLAPLAAFEGRQTISAHWIEGQVVTITVAKGVLRAVTAEQPAARIWLSGEEQAVRRVALMLAEAQPVAVPRASLAAEGIALATGRPPAPRHLGAPVLPEGPPNVPDALMHILGHLVDVMLAHAAVVLRLDAAGPEAVHQMRVAVRRARSALSIFRDVIPAGALATVNGGLKDLGSRLGPTRDWDVFVEETMTTIRDALPDDERLERLMAAATRQRRMHQKDLVAFLEHPGFRLLGIELAWFTAARFWHPAPVSAAVPVPTPVPVSATGEVAEAEAAGEAASASPVAAAPEAPSLSAFAEHVLQQRWKKLLSQGKRIDELDTPALHGVRLRAKRARYAAEMFATLYTGKASQRFIRRLAILQDRLGVLNDGAVATHLLAELGGPTGRHAYATGLIVGFLAARSAKIRPRIIRAFERFRRQPAYWT